MNHLPYCCRQRSLARVTGPPHLRVLHLWVPHLQIGKAGWKTTFYTRSFWKTTFYTRSLSICGFGYPQVSWNICPPPPIPGRTTVSCSFLILKASNNLRTRSSFPRYSLFHSFHHSFPCIKSFLS